MLEQKRHSALGATAIAGNVLAMSALAAKFAFALRKNNLQMLSLRENVVKADETGEGVGAAVHDLQSFVSAHMNSTPPKLGNEPAVQLKSSYDRAVATEKLRLTTARDKVNADAVNYCEAALPSSLLSDRANCIIEYNTARPITGSAVVVDLYKYDFVSPRWTPDVAGWSMLVLGVLAAVFVGQLVWRAVGRFVIF
jgi:hypothetical protein